MKISKVLFWLLSIGTVGTMAFTLGVSKVGAIKISNLFGFFKEKPVEVISSNVVIKQIQRIQELATAEYNMETVVEIEVDHLVGDSHLLYIASGKVKAGINLEEISNNNIQINNEGKKIIVKLPPSKIIDKKINVDMSKVYQYEGGWLSSKNTSYQLLTKAQQTAESKIMTGACQSKILETANQKAELAVDRLLTMTGYDVEVIPAATDGSCNLSSLFLF